MKENTQEKNLIEKSEKSLFGKIKNFFAKIFGKKRDEVLNNENSNIEENNNEFKESLKRTEDEDTKLLELQRRYRRGEIADDDLTDEQIDALCDLYDKQIEELKKSIEMKERKIEEYKKKNKQNAEENNA